ncbi:PstS family phosphate ABC transporter substrate-binding protein [Oscillatoriales cyanobacterium LEGE 11467]|uniref:Phosphate-binding protein n=1 Tax=Zarconia navalis LEGE 11467 TaxID=1828826 RepID=A0A928VW95_9CYAN|nr:PstS family phosphate ABC transporter substrate-binding protein [Zarconia navalis]MBE9039406.1 PstS family phosphate ABC transporter substrate-binding protein [Zarconia navalis LEGE 11467]
MTLKLKPIARMTSMAVAATTIALGAAQVRSQNASIVRIDGSSTVYPITEAVAEEFQISKSGSVRVTVGISGTGGGFRKFCAGETDISDASRRIKESEIEACKANGIDFIELPVAYDALTVVVSQDNPLSSITFEQLNAMWAPEAEGTVSSWNQVSSGWPSAPLNLYGPGSDSGTFDYFTKKINGEEGASRGDYTASEDDNVLVQGVASDVNALGYFGFAYYLENQGRLKGLAVDGGDGSPVSPSAAAVNDGSYPLSRPIFIYVSTKSMERSEVEEFVQFYLTQGVQYVSEVGYVPLQSNDYEAALTRFNNGETGAEPLREGL